MASLSHGFDTRCDAPHETGHGAGDDAAAYRQLGGRYRGSIKVRIWTGWGAPPAKPSGFRPTPGRWFPQIQTMRWSTVSNGVIDSVRRAMASSAVRPKRISTRPLMTLTSAT